MYQFAVIDENENFPKDYTILNFNGINKLLLRYLAKEELENEPNGVIFNTKEAAEKKIEYLNEIADLYEAPKIQFSVKKIK